MPEWLQSIESTIAALSESVAQQLRAAGADRLLAFDSCEKIDPAITRAVFEFRTNGAPSSCAPQAVADGTGTGPMAPRSCVLHLPKGGFQRTSLVELRLKHSQFGESVVSSLGVGGKSRGADGGHRGSVRSGAGKSAGKRLERVVAVVGFVHRGTVRVRGSTAGARQENPGCSLRSRSPLVAGHRARMVAVYQYNRRFVRDC